jgi:polysaccharide biosynthesis protein PelC
MMIQGEFMAKRFFFCRVALFAALFFVTGCAGSKTVYYDEEMDFGAVETLAVLPFQNLTRESSAAERVRDAFITRLLASGALYVIPTGEVARGIQKAEIATPTTPTIEEAIKLAGLVKAQAIITGVVREYGEVRSGTTSANTVAVSLQMIEAQTGKIVWSASSSKGGIGVTDRLFGGGGKPMEDVTQQAVDDLVTKLLE